MSIFYSTTIGAISEALAKAQGEMGKAHKSSTNPGFKSKYADLSACLDAVVPALSKHGIALTQLPGPVNGGTVSLTTILAHSSGEYIGSVASLDVGKSGPHAYGQGLTYLRRYSLAAITGLAQEDDDGMQAQQAHDAKPAAKPDYSVEKFTENLEAWSNLIEAGTHTADDIINTIKSKANLSPAQVKTIRNLEATGETA